jgi:hypothetical protein
MTTKFWTDLLGDVEQLSLEREGKFTAETVASLDDKGILYDKMLDMKVGIDRRNAGATISPPRDDQRSHESNTSPRLAWSEESSAAVPNPRRNPACKTIPRNGKNQIIAQHNQIVDPTNTPKTSEPHTGSIQGGRG